MKSIMGEDGKKHLGKIEIGCLILVILLPGTEKIFMK